MTLLTESPPAGIPLTSDCELLEEPQHAVHQVVSACYFWQSMSILFLQQGPHLGYT
jgi:hypothetical protein